MLAAAMLAAAIVSSLTIDLGPVARGYAEREGSKRLERGRCTSAGCRFTSLTGKFVVEDFSIDGLQPGDRPFFTAKRLSLALDWSTPRSQPEITIDSVEMTDWQMLVEKWEDRAQLPEVHQRRADRAARAQARSRRRSSTCTRRAASSRSRITRRRGASSRPISTSPSPTCRTTTATATFNGGTVTIQDYVPMWANMHAQFVIDGARMHLDRIDLDTDGATTVATRRRRLRRTGRSRRYQVKSRVHFPRMREIFFTDETWRLSGDGDFTGDVPSVQGRPRSRTGTFTSELAGVNDYRFPSLLRIAALDAGGVRGLGRRRRSSTAAPRASPTRSSRSAEHDSPRSGSTSSYTDVDLARVHRFRGLAAVCASPARASGHNLLEWPLGRFAEHARRGPAVVIAAAAGRRRR